MKCPFKIATPAAGIAYIGTNAQPYWPDASFLFLLFSSFSPSLPLPLPSSIRLLSPARLLPDPDQCAKPTVHLSRQKEAFFRGYGQIRLLFTLTLIHDLSEECRQVSSFGTRRNTVALGENAQPPLIHVLGIEFMHGLWTVVFYCE